jgi:hypothetical protein
MTGRHVRIKIQNCFAYLCLKSVFRTSSNIQIRTTKNSKTRKEDIKSIMNEFRNTILMVILIGLFAIRNNQPGFF